MNQFDYVRPASVAEAIAAAAAPGSAYLASGTNLLDLMKGGIVRPARLVDLSRLPGLDRIEPLADGAHDLAGCAVPALQAVMRDEGFLHRMKLGAVRHALDRQNVGAVVADRQRQA